VVYVKPNHLYLLPQVPLTQPHTISFKCLRSVVLMAILNSANRVNKTATLIKTVPY
jgi:hypothetical protein